MKILIAVPTYETITPECFKAIYDLRSEHELHFDYVTGYDCATARNNIAELALKGDYDYVLMVDSDTIVPEDTLEIMLEDPVEICLGICPRKNTRSGMTAIIKKDCLNWDDSYRYADLPEGRFEIKAGGFACALVKVDVFRDVPGPWFRWMVYDDGFVVGEDMYFCQLASAFDRHRIFADARVKCGHLARYFQYK